MHQAEVAIRHQGVIEFDVFKQQSESEFCRVGGIEAVFQLIARAQRQQFIEDKFRPAAEIRCLPCCLYRVQSRVDLQRFAAEMFISAGALRLIPQEPA